MIVGFAEDGCFCSLNAPARKSTTWRIDIGNMVYFWGFLMQIQEKERGQRTEACNYE